MPKILFSKSCGYQNLNEKVLRQNNKNRISCISFPMFLIKIFQLILHCCRHHWATHSSSVHTTIRRNKRFHGGLNLTSSLLPLLCILRIVGVFLFLISFRFICWLKAKKHKSKWRGASSWDKNHGRKGGRRTTDDLGGQMKLFQVVGFRLQGTLCCCSKWWLKQHSKEEKMRQAKSNIK